jgi:16S rRNA (uracil1498-N3)-methyltransferase
VPEVLAPQSFSQVLASWEADRSLIYCDEAAAISSPMDVLKSVTPPAAVLVGPEGGFTKEERAQLQAHKAVVAISLGPRIMRADTAAIAALALVQASLGDWG